MGSGLVYGWRILLLVIAVLFAWRIIAPAISNYDVDSAVRMHPEAIPSSTKWGTVRHDTLLRTALTLPEDDADTSEALLNAAFVLNPTDSRPLLAIAGIADSKGENERADALVTAAGRLRPVDSNVQQQIAGYSASRGKTQAAMRHWSLAMEADPAARKQLFPLLLKIAEDPGSRGAFKPFAHDPPDWWDAFFTAAASDALDVETVRVLYALRRENPGALPSGGERKVYIDRLVKDGHITEAYLVWVNGLSESELDHLGLLYDGGFEVKPSNMGFGWHTGRTNQVIVNRAGTYGVDDHKALHLVFKGPQGSLGYLFQRLFLDGGTYRVSGRVRTDSLKAGAGVKWAVACAKPEQVPLGESERFLGSGEWREFAFDIKVPEDCMMQEIRLRSGGTRAGERETSGGVWFDGMGIRKVSVPSEQAAT